MNKLIKYFTLGDLISLEDDTIEPNSSNDLDFKEDILTPYGLVIEDSSADKLLVLNQLMRMVYARFFDCYVYRKVFHLPWEVDETYAPDSGERKKIYRQFVEDFNTTAPRYLVLLKQFNDHSSDPLAKLETSISGTTRFNDTPQDGGDFADDGHTTNITQSETTTQFDNASIVEKLDALYRNWRSVLKDWTNEFRGLFYMVESED